jgi:hypothetical protein
MIFIFGNDEKIYMILKIAKNDIYVCIYTSIYILYYKILILISSTKHDKKKHRQTMIDQIRYPLFELTHLMTISNG